MRRIFRRILLQTIWWFHVPKLERIEEEILVFEKDVEGTKSDIRQLELDIASDQIYLESVKKYLILIENELDSLEKLREIELETHRPGQSEWT